MTKRTPWKWARIAAGLLLCAAAASGCGGQASGLEEFQAGNETPPAQAGSLEALVGTTWQLSRGQTMTFQENGQGTAAQPGGLPMSMRYELRPDGVVTVTLPGASRSGTWDGRDLILGGQKLKPLGRDPNAGSAPIMPQLPRPVAGGDNNTQTGRTAP